MATERRRLAVQHSRGEWRRLRLPFMRAKPERLVFIDETSIKTNLARQYGWAPKGERLQMDAPFGHWRTQTFIAGLTRDALIAPVDRR